MKMFTENDSIFADNFEITNLHKVIRKIRDTYGGSCKDWEALFKMLPEGYTPPARWIIGEPDSHGLWAVILADGWKMLINWTKNSRMIEASNQIIQSFGPIPEAPK